MLHSLRALCKLLLAQDVVVVAEIARLIPNLVNLCVPVRRDGPYALAQPLVALAVLLDALLNLALLQARGSAPAVCRDRMARRRVAHLDVAVDGGREARVVGARLALLEDLFDLCDCACLEEVLVLEASEDLRFFALMSVFT